MAENDDETDERSNEILSEAVANVQHLYNSEVCFFTKDRIREAYEELRKNDQPGDRVRIRGLDGKHDQFKIRSGVFGDEKDGFEWIYERPIIHYVSFQSLLDPDLIDFGSPYSNIRIVHTLAKRNKLTKEPANPRPDATRDEVESGLKTAIEKWKASPAWEQLKLELSRFQLPHVSKMVAFACGPIYALSNKKTQKCKNRSAFQHAPMVALRGLLNNTSSEIKCYAQDPAYTEHDSAALEAWGVTVLPDPVGFLEVDDSTVVFSFSPNVCVKQIVSDIARPAVIIWNRVKEGGVAEQRLTDPDSPRLWKWLVANYDTIDFPGDQDHFGDLVVHIRRPSLTEVESAGESTNSVSA